MALPAQALEKLAYNPEKTPGAYSQLLMLSASIFLLALFLWIGMAYGYEPYLNTQLANITQQTDDFANRIPPAQQEQIATLYSQLVNLKQVLGNHVATSPFFDWLSQNALPNVYFVKASVNSDASEVVLQGAARGLDDVNSELALLAASGKVKQLTVGTISNTVQGWQFSVTLEMDPALFKLQTSNQPSSPVSSSTPANSTSTTQ